MQKSFDLSRIKMFILSRWRLLLGAVSIYAPIFLAGQAGVCLIPPKHLQEEDYLFLGLKWVYEDTNRPSRQATVPYYSKDSVVYVPNRGRFITPIITKEDAVRFASTYKGCCTVRPGAAMEGDDDGIIASIIGKKIHTAEIVYFPDGPMDVRQKETYTVRVSFNQCGRFYDKASISGDTPRWLETSK